MKDAVRFLVLITLLLFLIESASIIFFFEEQHVYILAAAIVSIVMLLPWRETQCFNFYSSTKCTQSHILHHVFALKKMHFFRSKTLHLFIIIALISIILTKSADGEVAYPQAFRKLMILTKDWLLLS